MTINNYTLSEFFEQDEKLIAQYVSMLRFIKPKETKRQLMNMKLKHVELAKRAINESDDAEIIRLIKKVEKLSSSELANMKIIEFFSILNSVRKQLERIQRAEESLIPDIVNKKWEIVEGSKHMSKYGIYNTLDQLTEKKPYLYKKYMNMEYAEIFTILHKWKTEAELQFQMDQIKDIKP